MLSVVRISERLKQIDGFWQPQVVGTVNDFHVKLVRLQGSFLWHHHETEDELFLVISGTLRMHFLAEGEEGSVDLGAGELVVVPHGVEHKPEALGEVSVLLVEPATTLNTGTEVNERTWIDPAVG